MTRFILLGALSLGSWAPAISAPFAVQDTDFDFKGTWRGEIRLPFDPKPAMIRFGIEADRDGAWQGAADSDPFGPGLMVGETTDKGLRFECDLGGSTHPFTLSPDGEGLKGLILYSGFPIPIAFTREADDWAEDLRIEVELPAKRPETATLAGLPDFWLEEIEPQVESTMDSDTIVGLAMAVVVDGELMDVRSWGWSDVANGKSVDGNTLFRWGSISKTITGVVAAKMSVAGTIDLDSDVRELVPEFPEKKHVVTTRQLLGHLGGMPHYGQMPPVTRVDYGVSFPFRDPVRAIDMFKTAPLMHEPGSAYSYSTHGFALAGAALERSSKLGFKGEVERLVLKPLELSSLEPDDPSARRAARTLGYRVTNDGRTFESGDTDISWKLAGGGFHSTVEDLGRFAAGLCDEDYLSDAERELMWSAQATDDGEPTGYSFGLRVGQWKGRFIAHHGGAQRRTSTFMLSFPDDRIAVALMCNTEGRSLQALAYQVADVIFAEE